MLEYLAFLSITLSDSGLSPGLWVTGLAGVDVTVARKLRGWLSPVSEACDHMTGCVWQPQGLSWVTYSQKDLVGPTGKSPATGSGRSQRPVTGLRPFGCLLRLSQFQVWELTRLGPRKTRDRRGDRLQDSTGGCFPCSVSVQ